MKRFPVENLHRLMLFFSASVVVTKHKEDSCLLRTVTIASCAGGVPPRRSRWGRPPPNVGQRRRRRRRRRPSLIEQICKLRNTHAYSRECSHTALLQGKGARARASRLATVVGRARGSRWWKWPRGAQTSRENESGTNCGDVRATVTPRDPTGEKVVLSRPTVESQLNHS